MSNSYLGFLLLELEEMLQTVHPKLKLFYQVEFKVYKRQISFTCSYLHLKKNLFFLNLTILWQCQSIIFQKRNSIWLVLSFVQIEVSQNSGNSERLEPSIRKDWSTPSINVLFKYYFKFQLLSYIEKKIDRWS